MSVPADFYSDEVRRLFAAPAHAGRLDSARRARAEGQGVRIELSMKADGDTVGELRFLAYGCPHFVAAAESACAQAQGRPVADLAGVSAAALVARLPVPIEKTGRILVLEDAFRALAGEVGTRP